MARIFYDVKDLVPSEKCYALIRAYEGLRLDSYICPAGYPTIGYGHRIPALDSPAKTTPAGAESYLREDAEAKASKVKKLVQVKLTQGMFDALVDFVFNLGEGALASSTLLKNLNAEAYEAAANEFSRWIHVKGWDLAKINDPKRNGLIARRAAERTLFLSE